VLSKHTHEEQWLTAVPIHHGLIICSTSPAAESSPWLRNDARDRLTDIHLAARQNGSLTVT
jgi:hypothetical protein